MNLAIDWLVRPSIVLAIGLLATMLLRRQPAAVRHWILAAAIGFAAVQPLVTPVVPNWQMPSVSWRQSSAPAAAAAGSVDSDIAFEYILPASKATRTNWSRVAARTWLAGAAIGLTVIAAAIAWLMLLGRRASRAGQEWATVLVSVQQRLGFDRHVRISITRHPAMLVTWGAISPAILLPADADAWTTDRKELVVAHEMAHLMRHDWLIQLLAETARAIFWFNPLFWIACARLRHESECASDDIVLETGIAGTSYASHLVDLARTFRARPHLVARAFNCPTVHP